GRRGTRPVLPLLRTLGGGRDAHERRRDGRWDGVRLPPGPRGELLWEDGRFPPRLRPGADGPLVRRGAEGGRQRGVRAHRAGRVEAAGVERGHRAVQPLPADTEEPEHEPDEGRDAQDIRDDAGGCDIAFFVARHLTNSVCPFRASSTGDPRPALQRAMGRAGGRLEQEDTRFRDRGDGAAELLGEGGLYLHVRLRVHRVACRHGVVAQQHTERGQQHEEGVLIETSMQGFHFG
ncbi:hypothetical protein THAOC_13934, partial [Thalassiosira oceanica]